MSALRLICCPLAVNRHGWVLCTDGAHTAAVTTYLAISAAVSGSGLAFSLLGAAACEPLRWAGMRLVPIAPVHPKTPSAGRSEGPIGYGTFGQPCTADHNLHGPRAH